MTNSTNKSNDTLSILNDSSLQSEANKISFASLVVTAFGVIISFFAMIISVNQNNDKQAHEVNQPPSNSNITPSIIPSPKNSTEKPNIKNKVKIITIVPKPSKNYYPDKILEEIDRWENQKMELLINRNLLSIDNSEEIKKVNYELIKNYELIADYYKTINDVKNLETAIKNRDAIKKETI